MVLAAIVQRRIYTQPGLALFDARQMPASGLFSLSARHAPRRLTRQKPEFEPRHDPASALLDRRSGAATSGGG